jgi:plastocyanin
MAVTLSPRPERSNGTTAALREADPPRADTPRADAPRPAGRSRRPLTPLAALTAGATAALGVILFYIMAAIFKEVVPPAIGLGALALVVAAVVALLRRRWTPILGSVVALLLGAVLLVPAGSEIAHSLGTPNDPMFGVLIVLFPCLAIAVLAGIAAASVSPDVLAALPALGVKGFAFQQTELRVKAGEVVALRLDNADQAPHSFDVDELGVHAPIPVGQGGMALFRPTAPGTYTFYCAPHYDKASGQGMKGTLIVE